MARVWFDRSRRGVMTPLPFLLAPRQPRRKPDCTSSLPATASSARRRIANRHACSRFNVDGRRLLASTPVHNARENTTAPVVTADGRYLAWI